MIGDMLHARYHIVDKLGFGGYSTIWLARDTRQEQYVAVKVGIADATLPRETKILRALSSSSVHPGRKAIPVPLDEFQVHGPNGIHNVLYNGSRTMQSQIGIFQPTLSY
jgi:serine/threonine protein kinase